MIITHEQALLLFGEKKCFQTKDGTALLCNYVQARKPGYVIARDNGGFIKILLRFAKKIRSRKKKTVLDNEDGFPKV